MAKSPTPRQLRYLRALANQTGTTFTPPKSAAEASRAIQEMQQRTVSPRHEIAADRHSVTERAGARSGTDVTDGEVSAYGSNARWTQGGR
jgi:hypothetical protein